MTDELLAAIEHAERTVDDLCQGRLRWVMNVPAEPDRDPDLVISAALSACKRDIPALLDVADAAREAERAQDALDEHDVTHDEWNYTARAPFARRLSLAMEDLRTALARLDEGKGKG